MATNLRLEQIAASVVLQLGGLARRLAREVTPQHLAYGMPIDLEDGMGSVPRTSLFVLIRGLGRRFAPLDVEQGCKAIAQILAFRRVQNESVDTCLSRFDLTSPRRRSR
eukprot:10071960-Heterocapsa_arctica.AAC.1